MAESYVGISICFDCLYKIFYGEMCKVNFMQWPGFIALQENRIEDAKSLL